MVKEFLVEQEWSEGFTSRKRERGEKETEERREVKTEEKGAKRRGFKNVKMERVSYR